MDHELQYVVIILSASIVLCAILLLLFPTDLYIVTQRTFFRRPFHCEGWSLGHFLLYALLGYFAPSYWHVLILIGILWEFLEEGGTRLIKMMHNRVTIGNIAKNSRANQILFHFSFETYVGRLEDIVVNTVGVIFGVLVHKWMTE